VLHYGLDLCGDDIVLDSLSLRLLQASLEVLPIGKTHFQGKKVHFLEVWSWKKICHKKTTHYRFHIKQSLGFAKAKGAFS